MRLLNTKTFEQKEFFDSQIPPYAILSHRWTEDEFSYWDLKGGRSRDDKSFAKIRNCCDRALADNLQWLWVDTCCIDKSSSAELSEAINSMFRWYQGSTRCYAYLSDVHGAQDGPAGLHWPTFTSSIWFTRGWTLQELIAPSEVFFFDSLWREIGSRTLLMEDVEAATGIPEVAFKSLRRFSVAAKMSWAATRETSRVEDLAYSLLGLFDVSMPLIYGEGDRAFTRLQEEIIRNSDDETIFAWFVRPTEEASAVKALRKKLVVDLDDASMCPMPTKKTGTGNLLAPKPIYFQFGGEFQRDNMVQRLPYSLSNKGLQISTVLFTDPNDEAKFLIPLNCITSNKLPVMMFVTRLPGGFWVRSGCFASKDAGSHWFESQIQSAFEDRSNAALHEIIVSKRWPSEPIYRTMARRDVYQETAGVGQDQKKGSDYPIRPELVSGPRTVNSGHGLDEWQIIGTKDSKI